MTFHSRTTLWTLGLLAVASSCGYDWDSVEPDGTAAWGGAGGAVGGSGGTGGGQAGSAGTAGTGGTATGGTGGTATGGTGGTATGGTGGTATGGSAGSAGSGGGPVACDEPDAERWSDNGHCYFIVDGASHDWFTQRDACDAAGAHLVTITSQAEQDFVEPIGGGDRWMGYSRISANEFSWITGETSNYDNWRQGEPNESGDACARMRDNGEWADRGCDSSQAAICERE